MVIMSTYLNKDFGAANYAKFRPKYPTNLFDYIAKYHSTNTNAPLDLTVDIACGTGQATQALGKYSTKVIGVDHSETMVKQAREDIKSSQFEFKVASDLNLGEEVGHSGAVDLVTVAEGAHYFHYPEFWEQAAGLLRPGGTLAIFGYSLFAVPDHPEIAAIIDDFANSDNKCGPYFDKGWSVIRDGYRELLDSIPRSDFEAIEYHFNDYDAFRPDDVFELTRENVSIGSMISLLKTWSSYFNFARAHPEVPDIADAVMDEITKKTGLRADDIVSVKWRSVYLLASKK